MSSYKYCSSIVNPAANAAVNHAGAGLAKCAAATSADMIPV